MKIIKEGNPERLRQDVRFECDACGCIFEANIYEYKHHLWMNELYYTCNCPTCNKSVTVQKERQP